MKMLSTIFLTSDNSLQRKFYSWDRLILTHPCIAGFHPQENHLKGKAHQRGWMEGLSAEEGSSFYKKTHDTLVKQRKPDKTINGSTE
jgi:hypothetical protein